MTPQGLVSGLCDYMGLPQLAPNGDGVIPIVFDENYEIHLRKLSDRQLLIESQIASVPDDEMEREDFLKTLLRRNLVQLRDQRPSLSLDENKVCAILHLTVQASECELYQFLEIVEDFLNCHQWWMEMQSAVTKPITANELMAGGILRP